MENAFVRVSRAPGATPPGWPPTQYAAYPQPPTRYHRHKHRSRQERKRSNFNSMCCGFDGIGTHRKRNGPDRYEFKERTGLAISIDSADEDDWDAPLATRKVWGERKAPCRERPVDDLLITMQDLFPCLGPVLDCCNCSRRRQKRVLPCKSNCHQAGGPKLETVCLDCGNVIDSRSLPRTVNLDMFDRQDPQRHVAFINGMYGEENSPNTMGNFEGYKDWAVLPEDPGMCSQRQTDYTPLPEFHTAPPRIFKNAPTDAVTRSRAESRQYDSSHVELPDFPST